MKNLIDLENILDKIIIAPNNSTFKNSSNSKCFNIDVSDNGLTIHELMICKIFTDIPDKMDYLIRFYDENGFFVPGEFKIDTSKNNVLYTKCEQVLELANNLFVVY